jgi:hypothetical protein
MGLCQNRDDNNKEGYMLNIDLEPIPLMALINRLNIKREIIRKKSHKQKQSVYNIYKEEIRKKNSLLM